VQALWVSDRHGLARFDSIQPHYNLVHRCDFEPELQTVCRTYGLGVLPYSPLAGGFLTGKYHRAGIQPDSVRKDEVSRYMTDRNWTLLTLLEQIAMASGDHSISQVALAWMLTNPLITSPIIGPHNPMQLVDNLGALELRLNEKDLERIGQASCLKENDPEEN
jgi:aryl-alcohol dehydrogenase-like predicted oxidoreductase